MERRRIIACGLFRSGTTYLQQLINNHFETEITPPDPRLDWAAYKHIMKSEHMHYFPPGTFVALTYKSLIKWVDSLCRNSFDLINDHELSLQKGHTPIVIAYRDDNKPDDEAIPVQVSLEKVIGVYHDHIDFWKQQKLQAHWFYHRDMVFQPEKRLQEFAKRFRLSMKPFKPIKEGVRNSPRFDSSLYWDANKVEFLKPDQVRLIKKNSINIEELIWNRNSFPS